MSAGRTPPSPWIGSTMMPAVRGPIASRTAFMLLNGTWSKPSTTGPKPSRYLALPVAASVASVRPWNAPSKQMKRKRSRLAGVGHGAAHHLDHALVRLGARVAEEHAVGERRVDQPLRQPLGLRDAIQVGHVHHLGGLLGDRLGTDAGGRGPARRWRCPSRNRGIVARPPSTARRLRPARRRGRHGRSSAAERKSWVCYPFCGFPTDPPPATIRGGSRGSADHWRLCGRESNAQSMTSLRGPRPIV